MAKFEVFIPKSGPDTFDMTLKVEAENWLAALNAGMKKIGEKGGAGTNVLVDIQDDESIHVTDPKSGRVFRIKEKDSPAPAPEAKQEKTQVGAPNPFAEDLPPNPFDPRPARPRTAPLMKGLPQANMDMKTAELPSPFATESSAPPPAAIAPTMKSSSPPKPAASPAVSARPPTPMATARPATGSTRSRPPSILPSASEAEKPLPPRPKPARRPSSIAEVVEEVPKAEVKAPAGRIGRERTLSPDKIDETLADLFERSQELENYSDPEEALYFLLDMAMEKIAADSGSVFLADLSSNELNVGAARGPKSEELLKLNPRVPMGVGIVGFSAQESVALALSDVHRDPRFFKAISQRLGYETRSILCAPMMFNGRCFGCLEVINKKSTSRFSEGELAILSYLAERGARYLEMVG